MATLAEAERVTGEGAFQLRCGAHTNYVAAVAATAKEAREAFKQWLSRTLSTGGGQHTNGPAKLEEHSSWESPTPHQGIQQQTSKT